MSFGGGRGRGRGVNNKFAHIPGAGRGDFQRPASTVSNGPGGSLDPNRLADSCPELLLDPPPESTPEEDDLHDIGNTYLDLIAASPFYIKPASFDKSAIPVVPRYSDMHHKSSTSNSTRLNLSSSGLEISFFPEELHGVLDPSRRSKRMKFKRNPNITDIEQLRKLAQNTLENEDGDEENDEDENRIEEDDAWDEEEDDDGDDDYNAERYFDNDEAEAADDDGGEAEF